eukprot:1118537_1
MYKIFITLFMIYQLSFGAVKRRLLGKDTERRLLGKFTNVPRRRLLQGGSAVHIPTTVPGVTIPANAGPPANVVCNIPCSNTNCPAESCAAKITNYENPSNSFTMSCTARGSCAGSQININYGANGAIKFLESLVFSAEYAVYGATITINNQQTQENVKVRTIECGTGNCAGASFVFIGADYGDLKCEEYGGCGAGCTVTQHDVVKPCDTVSTT